MTTTTATTTTTSPTNRFRKAGPPGSNLVRLGNPVFSDTRSREAREAALSAQMFSKEGGVLQPAGKREATQRPPTGATPPPKVRISEDVEEIPDTEEAEGGLSLIHI